MDVEGSEDESDTGAGAAPRVSLLLQLGLAVPSTDSFSAGALHTDATDAALSSALVAMPSPGNVKGGASGNGDQTLDEVTRAAQYWSLLKQFPVNIDHVTKKKHPNYYTKNLFNATDMHVAGSELERHHRLWASVAYTLMHDVVHAEWERRSHEVTLHAHALSTYMYLSPFLSLSDTNPSLRPHLGRVCELCRRETRLAGE